MNPAHRGRAGVVYVAGYGRSGSTVLDMLVSSFPGVFGAGELTYLFDELQSGAVCACGRSLARCEFWPGVLERWTEATGFSIAEGASLTRRREQSRLRPSAWVQRVNERAYRSVWTAMFDAIAAGAGAEVIVDSSKTMGDAARRPQALVESIGRPMTIAHLVRRPEAILHSVSTGRGPRGGGPRRYPGLAASRTAATWPLANAAASRAMTRAGLGLVIRYEDLVAAPHRVAAELLGTLGFEVEDSPREHVSLAPGHGIRGNRVRGSGTVLLTPDDRWRSASRSRAQRAAGLALRAFGRRYGYA